MLLDALIRSHCPFVAKDAAVKAAAHAAALANVTGNLLDSAFETGDLETVYQALNSAGALKAAVDVVNCTLDCSVVSAFTSCSNFSCVLSVFSNQSSSTLEPVAVKSSPCTMHWTSYSAL